MSESRTSESKGHATRVWVATVHVADFDRSLRFYRDLLGFPVRLEARPFGWMELGPKEPLCKIGLSLRPEDRTTPGQVRPTGIILEVDDMEAFGDRLKSASVSITRGPTKTPWGGEVVDFLDPDGNELQAVFDPDHYVRERDAPRLR